MPAYNYPLRENVRQAFAGGQGNAFQTMLRMLASTVPGGIEAQNAYIARITGASIRTVRRILFAGQLTKMSKDANDLKAYVKQA